MSSSRTARAGRSGDEMQAEANARLWARQDLANNHTYTGSELRAPERVIISTYLEGLSERVLELGCGPGRLTGHLAKVAESLHAIDVSPAMVEACQSRHPGVTAEVMDLREVADLGQGSFGVVVAPYNVLDVLGDRERHQVLADLHGVLRPHGYLVMSSHNLNAPPDRLLAWPKSLRQAAGTALRLPGWVRTRRKLLRFERVERDYAILNDVSHDWGALHYYTTRDAQESQLEAHGFELLDCLDLAGNSVPAGARSPGSSELHYVARRTS